MTALRGGKDWSRDRKVTNDSSDEEWVQSRWDVLEFVFLVSIHSDRRRESGKIRIRKVGIGRRRERVGPVRHQERTFQPSRF